VLAKHKSKDVNSSIFKSREWFIIDCAMTVVKEFLHAIYIFNYDCMSKDYIKLCRPRICMAKEGKEDSVKAW
jgi:hypothetical protein